MGGGGGGMWVGGKGGKKRKREREQGGLIEPCKGFAGSPATSRPSGMIDTMDVDPSIQVDRKSALPTMMQELIEVGADTYVEVLYLFLHRAIGVPCGDFTATTRPFGPHCPSQP